MSLNRELRNAFVTELTQGYSHFDRQLRNDLLTLACQVAYANPYAPFIETGFAKHLILFATYPECTFCVPFFSTSSLQFFNL